MIVVEIGLGMYYPNTQNIFGTRTWLKYDPNLIRTRTQTEPYLNSTQTRPEVDPNMIFF